MVFVSWRVRVADDECERRVDVWRLSMASASSYRIGVRLVGVKKQGGHGIITPLPCFVVDHFAMPAPGTLDFS